MSYPPPADLSRATAWMADRARRGAPSLQAYIPLDDIHKGAQAIYTQKRIERLPKLIEDPSEENTRSRPSTPPRQSSAGIIPDVCSHEYPEVQRPLQTAEDQSYEVATPTGADIQQVLRYLTEYALLYEYSGKPDSAAKLNTLALDVVRVAIDFAETVHFIARVAQNVQDYVDACRANHSRPSLDKLRQFDDRFLSLFAFLGGRDLSAISATIEEVSQILVPETFEPGADSTQVWSLTPTLGRNMSSLGLGFSVFGQASPYHLPAVLGSLVFGFCKGKDMQAKYHMSREDNAKTHAEQARATVPPAELLEQTIRYLVEAHNRDWTNALGTYPVTQADLETYISDLLAKVTDLNVVMERWGIRGLSR